MTCNRFSFSFLFPNYLKLLWPILAFMYVKAKTAFGSYTCIKVRFPLGMEASTEVNIRKADLIGKT